MKDRSDLGLTRILCHHCDQPVEVWSPWVGEDMNPAALETLGRAIMETRLLHAILDCEALKD